MAAKKKYLVSTRGNDLTKTWFVFFTDEKGKRVRKYGKINQQTTVEGRLAAAQQLIAQLEGAKPDAPIIQKMAAYLQSKQSEWRKKTYQSYHSKLDTFTLWLGGRDISQAVVAAFLDHVAGTRQPATYNWYVSFFRTILKRVGAPELMPAVEVKRANSTPAMYFQRYQVQRLKAYLLKNDPEII